jgi:hypothetical protein
VHQQYDGWQKSIRVLSVRGAYVLGAVGVGLLFLLEQEIARITGFAILLYAVSSYHKWEGHREGYTVDTVQALMQVSIALLALMMSKLLSFMK